MKRSDIGYLDKEPDGDMTETVFIGRLISCKEVSRGTLLNVLK